MFGLAFLDGEDLLEVYFGFGFYFKWEDHGLLDFLFSFLFEFIVFLDGLSFGCLWFFHVKLFSMLFLSLSSGFEVVDSVANESS